MIISTRSFILRGHFVLLGLHFAVNHPTILSLAVDVVNLRQEKRRVQSWIDNVIQKHRQKIEKTYELDKTNTIATFVGKKSKNVFRFLSFA